MRKPIVLALALALALALPGVSWAAEMQSGETVTIGTSQVIDENLYAAGGMVSLDGEVRGDAHVVGGNLTVTGSVADDLTAAGGSLVLLGPVGGDLRFAGGDITFGSPVGGELVAAGGNITTTPSVTVGGDAVIAGGNVVVKGHYAGDLAVYAGEVRIDGTVEGNLLTKAETVTLASGAVVRGSYLHEGPKEATVEDGATVDGERAYNFRQFERDASKDADRMSWSVFGRAFGAMFLFFVLIKFLAYLLVSLLLTWQLPGISRAVVSRTLGNFGTDLLTGFLIMVVAPFALLLAGMTVVGWAVACIVCTALVLAGMVGAAYSTVSFGALIRKMGARGRKDYPADWKSALLGTVLLTLVMLIPVFGWAVGLLFCLASFGTVVRLAYGALISRR
ncbi:MAG: hypothetical protein ABIJ46_00155 [bacterium]